VGKTGTLTSVDLILAEQGLDDLIRVDIRGTTGGNPNLDDGAVVASRVVAASSLPGFSSKSFVTIDLSNQAIPCVAGQVMAIVLIRLVGSGSSDVLWITENTAGEDYAGGTALQRNGGSGTAWTSLPNDFYFRTRVLSP
jgi:hypothetical protein